MNDAVASDLQCVGQDGFNFMLGQRHPFFTAAKHSLLICYFDTREL